MTLVISIASELQHRLDVNVGRDVDSRRMYTVAPR